LGIITWHEILTRVVTGFGEVPEGEELVKPILEIAEHLKDLKHMAKYPDLLRFFKENHLDPDLVDKIADDSKSIIINDFDPECLRAANYDLRLGDEAYVTTDDLPKKLTLEHDSVVIRPGEFGILTTFEYIHVPDNLLGLISLRFNYKKLGLVNISGFHVDPGFTGRIIFSVFNTGPRDVVLRLKEPVFMIMFERLDKHEEITEYDRSFNKQKHIPVDIVTALGGPSVSVKSLDGRLQSIETQLKVLYGLIIGLAVPILAYIVQLILQYFGVGHH
jgi:dCTP deaminase